MKNHKRNISTALLSGSFSLLGISSIYAANDTPPSIGDLTNVVVRVMGGIEDYFVPFAGVTCVIFVILAGYKWITAGGNPDQISSASKTLTWAIIGLVFVFISKLLLSTIIGKIID